MAGSRRYLNRGHAGRGVPRIRAPAAARASRGGRIPPTDLGPGRGHTRCRACLAGPRRRPARPRPGALRPRALRGARALLPRSVDVLRARLRLRGPLAETGRLASLEPHRQRGRALPARLSPRPPGALARRHARGPRHRAIPARAAAIAGTIRLARRLGMGPWGGWVTGTVYGLGGFVLSTVSLLQLFQAAAWAPWVIAAFLATVRHPDTRRRGRARRRSPHSRRALWARSSCFRPRWLGIVLLDASRRAARSPGAPPRAERPPSPCPRCARSPGGAGSDGGSARQQGFAKAQALAFSLHPVALGETLLPKLLGDPHAFSDADDWGRGYFPEGVPYLLSIYVGLPALLLAVCARGRRKLWWLAAAGSGAFARCPRSARAAAGVDRLALARPAEVRLSGSPGGRPARGLRAGAPPLSKRHAAGGASGSSCPAWRGSVSCWRCEWTRGAVRAALAAVLLLLADPRGLVAARSLWPDAWLPSAALALAAGLALALGGAWARTAALVRRP